MNRTYIERVITRREVASIDSLVGSVYMIDGARYKITHIRAQVAYEKHPERDTFVVNMNLCTDAPQEYYSIAEIEAIRAESRATA